MSSVTQFKNFLFKKSLSKNKVRYTLYNYLNLFCYAKQKFTPEVLDGFYRSALSFPYWRTWCSVLREGIEEELHGFAKEHALFSEFKLVDWKLKHYNQCIVINNTKDLMDVVRSFLERKASKGDKIKVFDFHSNQVIAVVLKLNQHIKVYSFSPLVILNKGYLEPICPFSELHYSAQCELHSSYWHQVRTPDAGFVRFQLKKDKLYGYEYRDSFFRAINHFQGISVEEHNMLFDTLKQLEGFFIEPRSDQYYKQLVQMLHDHYKTLCIRSFNSMTDKDISKTVETIGESLLQAKKAIKYFYPEDPLLVLLIANIEFHLIKMFPQHKQQSKSTTALNEFKSAPVEVSP